MGLRADKQRHQRIELIENAIALMREHGELPPMRELARRCRVSEATIFNYFGQREALLGEWAHRDLSQHAAAVTASGPGSLRRAVRQIDRRLAQQAAREPLLWLRIWSSAPASDPSLGRPGGAEPGTEAAGTRELAIFARARGEVRADQPPEDQARALASAWLGALSREARLAAVYGAGRDGSDAGLDADAWKRVESAVELVVDGLRKRHERVRMRSAPGAAVHSASPRG
jgi:AcrR family transcriptional regulator